MPSCIWYSAHKHVIAASFFPCELYPFSNHYIFRLRIYKLQYEKAHGEVPVGGESAEGSSPTPSEPSSASSAAEPGSSVVASAGHPTKRDITTPEQYANEGHELAARAVAAVGGVGQPNYYSPVAPLPSSIPSPQTSLMPTLTSSILTTAASLTASVAYSTLTTIHQNAAEAAANSTSSSEASSTGGEVELTPEEQTFIYKTFLITGGLIMTINSFIKLLNTKVHGEFRRLLFLFLSVSLPDPYMITHLLCCKRYLRENYYSVSHSECHCSMEYVCSSLHTAQCSIIDIGHDWLAHSPSLD